MDITFDCSSYELPPDEAGTPQEDWNPNNE